MNENSLINKTKLRSMIKEHKMQCQPDAFDFLIDHIDKLSDLLLVVAKENLDRRNRKTITEDDVEKAFNTLLEKHNTCDETISALRDTISHLESVKEKAPLLERLGR